MNSKQQLQAGNKFILVLLITAVLIIFGMGAYYLGSRQSQFINYTDNSDIFTLKAPKNYGANGLYSYVTDSCTLFSDESIVNPDISTSEAAKLQKDGTFIEVCYTSNSFPDVIPAKITTPEDSYDVLSSAPFSINGYAGFKAQVKSIHSSVKEVVILKSPYGGYVTASRGTNGQDVFNTMISSFHYIRRINISFTTADQTLIRNMFSDQSKKDITVTFGYPSADQNSVGGMVYLPQGQKCFNADRSSSGWKISYISSGITDAKCYNFLPITPQP